MPRYTLNHIFHKKQKVDNTITDPIEIAENFNNFFTSLGANLQKKILPTKNTFTDYLKKPNTENFIIAPTTPEEISDLIIQS